MNEEAMEKLIKIYSELENKLIIEIVKHFNVNEEFINSDYWRFEKLKELGALNENTIKYIAIATDRTPDEIRKALNKIGFSVVDIDKLNAAYRNNSIKIDPQTLIENQVVENLINHSYNELTNRFLEISNKIENATREAYLDIVEKAYLQTVNGVTYQEAILNALSDFGDKGISTLTYKTIDKDGNIKGIRNYDIEGTVRRELITANHNLVNSINQKVAEELDVEFLYLSEHIKCRPEHFPWQGTIIRKEDLVKVTRYGEVDGLGSPNCKHYPSPYFGNARGNELKRISLEEATEQYNLSQQQRYLERGIRKWKRKQVIAKKAEDKEGYKKASIKAREWQDRLAEFTNDNELKRDYTREYIKDYKAVTIREKDDIILLPNYQEAIIPPEKFTEYALNPLKDKNKAEAFEKALGYNLSNSDKLIENIRNNIDKFNAKEKEDLGYGPRYEIIMRLLGENNKEANVKTAWIIDKDTKQTKLTSAYVTSKQWKKEGNNNGN